MFASKARATQLKHLSGAPLLGKLQTSPTNIRLGQKILSVRNKHSSLLDHLQITVVKSLTLGLGGSGILEVFNHRSSVTLACNFTNVSYNSKKLTGLIQQK